MSAWTFEKACSFVNMDHPAITSLLYDLGLLPEQISSNEKKAQMILIVAHFIAAEEDAPPPGDGGLREALAFYAEPKNYRPPGGSDEWKEPMENDRWDNGLPGSKARAALGTLRDWCEKMRLAWPTPAPDALARLSTMADDAQVAEEDGYGLEWNGKKLAVELRGIVADLSSLGRPAETQGDGRGAQGDTGRLAWTPKPDTGASASGAPRKEGEG